MTDMLDQLAEVIIAVVSAAIGWLAKRLKDKIIKKK